MERNKINPSPLDELITVFSQVDDAEAMKKLFEEIFTPAERKDLALRWQLMKMVSCKVPQRKIAAELKISLCKITRGAKVLKNPESITKNILQKLEESQQ